MKWGKSLQGKYYYHRHTASLRGIEFLLTFNEWLQIWTDSGHLHERGRKRGQYCMARLEDKGAYVVGNVKIITGDENTKEACLGRKHSKELLEKQRINTTSLWKNPSFREKVMNGHAERGYKPSEETKQKMRIAALGQIMSPEARQKMSIAKKAMWAARKAAA